MFFNLKISSHLHLGLSSVVLSWGFLTHFDGISHIIFLSVNIVIMCRSVNYEVPQTQKSNILVERRMHFKFFTISLNHVLWMFSLLKKCDVQWTNFCIVPCGRFISSIEEDIVYQIYITGKFLCCFWLICVLLNGEQLSQLSIQPSKDKVKLITTQGL